jgi:NADP-dependent 3-hydroxy acid dehydrogenase YdfG
MMRILICGATSAIAAAAARRFVPSGAQFFLVARGPEKVTSVVSDLTALGATQVDTGFKPLAAASTLSSD